MPAYLELHVKGNGRAYVEAGMIGAVITGPGCDVNSPGTATSPVRVVLRSGETLDTIGQSAGHILVRAMDVRELARTRKAAGVDEFAIDYMAAVEAPGA